MSSRLRIAAAILASLILLPAVPALADGEIQITHGKALAGNVTPGDAPGYPVRITIPGIFKLASNLFVAANKIGIQVTSKNVTIDLNGFSMQGSDVAFHGITGGVDNVTIRNGTIDSFEFDGIVGTGDRWVVERMQVLDNGRVGIQLAAGGSLHRVHDNTVAGNGSTGIRCGSCVISENVVGNNGDVGIEVNGATVLGNYIIGNTGFGLSAGVFGNGFAHNVLADNNGGAAGDQVSGALPLHPNICVNVAC
jgi:hypothetical protein